MAGPEKTVQRFETWSKPTADQREIKLPVPSGGRKKRQANRLAFPYLIEKLSCKCEAGPDRLSWSGLRFRYPLPLLTSLNSPQYLKHYLFDNLFLRARKFP